LLYLTPTGMLAVTICKLDDNKLDDKIVLKGSDTANCYQKEESEIWIGEWLAKRGVRDDVVIATKYTGNVHDQQVDKYPNQINRSGNSVKSMMVSLEASLKKLGTTYVDVLYMHWWDWTTPIEEVMQGLNNLVKAGKVLYLGVSDTPAWVITKANQYARDHGLAQFVLYQGRWSVKDRDLERELLPMCISEGMGIAPWGAIGQGSFQRKADQGKSKDGRSAKALSEDEKKVSAALEKVADELNIDSVTAVALAWCMSKYPYVYPIIGGRKIEHLKSNAQALDIHLSPEQVRFLDNVLPFDYGQPMSQFGLDPHMFGYQGHPNLQGAGLIDFVPLAAPIDMTKVRESDAAAEKEAKEAAEAARKAV